MTDDEAFKKYLKEIYAELGTAVVVQLDESLELIKTHTFQTSDAANDLVFDLSNTQLILVENFESKNTFYYVGTKYLMEFDRKIEKVIDYVFIVKRPEKIDLEALSKEISRIGRAFLPDSEGPKLPC